jgi:tetratricopeptide (TPR) repeat protein
MRISSIAGNMPTVRKALDPDVTISLWNDGKIDELVSLYKKAIAEAQKMQGSNSVAEAAVQQELGDLYIKKGNYKNAEPAFRRAIAILQMPPNAKAQQDILGECFQGIGYVCMNKKQYAKAVDAFKQWIAIMEKDGHLTQDPSSETFAMALDSLAEAHVKQNNYRAAETLLKRSLAMRKVTYGEHDSTTNYVVEHLLEVYDALGKTSEIAKIENNLIESKKRELPPELGSFYAQQAHQSRKSNCALPLIATLGPGAEWNQKRFTQEIEKKLGTASDANWYKIPNWFAGLWSDQDIPKEIKVEEINGVLRSPEENPTAFHTGPLPYYAARRGFVRTRIGDEWWHYDENQSNWTQSGRSDSKDLGYIYYQNIRPVTNRDGSITFRAVALHFYIKPKVAYNFNSLFPAGTILRVWQQDNIMTYKQVAPRKYALYTCERMYDWNGKERRVTPEGDKVFWLGGASWQKKVGDAAPAKFVGMDLKQELRKYLTKRRMFDELKRLEN